MAITHDKIVSMLSNSLIVSSDEFALETIDMFPHWKDTIGIEITQEMINKGYDRYQYNNKLYKIVQPHTPQVDWTPDVTPALWVEVSLEKWPEWKQPAGAHDAYAKDSKVTHNNKKWTSTVDSNVWEPGVYGWTEIS